MKRSVPITALLFVVLAGLLSLAGCGGKSVDFATWAGTYSGTVTLDHSKSGVPNLVSDNAGLVSGTLVVTGTNGTDTNFKFVAGTYNVSGSITSTGGGFEVDGVVPNNGGFIIRGSFPTDASTRSFRVVTSVSSTFSVSLVFIGNLQRV